MEGGVKTVSHTKRRGDNKKENTPVKNREDDSTHRFPEKYEIRISKWNLMVIRISGYQVVVIRISGYQAIRKDYCKVIN